MNQSSNNSEKHVFVFEACVVGCPSEFLVSISKETRKHSEDNHLFQSETTRLWRLESPSHRVLLLSRRGKATVMCDYARFLPFKNLGGLSRDIIRNTSACSPKPT